MLDLLQNNLFQKAKKALPVASFFGGFTWDSVTLGKLVQTSDLAFLFVYYVASFAALILLSAGERSVFKFAVSDKWRDRFTYAVQFCFGSLFSALVICYFKSSATVGAFCLVALLAVFLVANEFLQKRYSMFGFSLAMFGLLGAMYLNFLIPHLVNRMGFFWFLISALLSFGMCALAYKLSGRSAKVLIAPGVISVLLIFAYIANWIPPVPLVLKDQNACVGFSKDYSCAIDKPGIFERLGLKSPTVTLSANDAGVSFVSSVFAPSSVEAQLEHRWWRKNSAGDFELMNKISSPRMKTHGSRENGFRIHTVKKNVPDGEWKVETAVKDGPVIGSKTFRVRRSEAAPERIPWKIR